MGQTDNIRSRRSFLKTAGLGLVLPLSGGNSLPCSHRPIETHIISLSFDDGFKKSSIQTAELYEKYGLSACINVIATAHETGFVLPNEWHDHPVGDFDLWNELQSRGHEIMPHGYMHTSLRDTPFEKSKELVLKCLDYFSKELKGFESKECIFNFPYNQSSPEIEEWISTQVKAFRTTGGIVNQLPEKGVKKLTCGGHGPENIDNYLENEIQKFLKLSQGWFIFNTHGLDGEGWGPMTSGYLDDLLGRMSKLENVAVIPVGVALKSFT